MFFRLVVLIVLMGGFVNGQTPVAASSTPQESPEPVKAAPDQAAKSNPRTNPELILPTVAAPPPTASQELEKIGKGVTAPVPIYIPQAKYTREARKKKIQGPCLISMIVDTSGAPQSLKVVRSIGYGLDESALAAVRQYKFRPAMKDGHPVAVQMSIEVNFRLY